MAATLTWIHHASFRLHSAAGVVYIDPWKISGNPGDGDLVLISHSHYDHLSADDVAKVSGPGATILGARDVAGQLPGCQPIAPGESTDAAGVGVRALRAYNTNKNFHPRGNDWLGFVVETPDGSVYYAGDTDVIDEMYDVGSVSLALLPVGGTYTMTASEAAEAAAKFDARRVLPYHWGHIVGQRSDAVALSRELGDKCVVLDPGGSLEL